MENLKNRIDFRLVNNKKDYLKYTSKPSYMSHKIFDNNLVAIRKIKVGMCILEMGKVLMYGFHYDYIKNKYDRKSNLLFADTDSLMYKIKTENVYEDFNSDKEMLEFSNYSTKSKYYDNSNK